MRKVALSELKDDLSRYLRMAEREEIVVTRHGKPAGVLIGFESEDDWFEYRLQSDPRFLARIERARRSLRAGQGVRMEDLDEHGDAAEGAGGRRQSPRRKTARE
jgi:prevent-host-death family protein